MEICPLLEEFGTILGSQMNFAYQIVIPQVGIPHLHFIQYQMARLFNLSPQSSLHYIFGTEILMESFLEVVIAANIKEVY